jgi:multimeric flavodoxin WrbA
MAKTAGVILSSPRKGSNSSALALALAGGFEEAGGLTRVVDLSGLDIKPCLACEACQRNGGKCVQVDGMQTVYPTVLAADTLILASPVYWFNLSAQLKIFLDRCYAVARSGTFASKTIALALTYGETDPFASGGVNAIRSIQDICVFTGARWGGCVYGSATDRETLAKNEELLSQTRALGRKLWR